MNLKIKIDFFEPVLTSSIRQKAIFRGHPA